MERLTKREILKTSNNEEFVGCNIEIGQMNSCPDCNDSCMYGSCEWQEKANLKLKHYEDLEEQGLLLKEEDVLKFYYCESEDKYLVGQRVGTMYYAEVGKTGLCFIMSRYLPWGEHVVAPHTVWKEHTYPSEPKEIPFFDWLQGYIKQLISNAEAEKALAEMERLYE